LVDVLGDARPEVVRRGAELQRQLISADIIAGSLAGALTALVAGLSLDSLPIVALAVGLGWPLLAALCGLYSSDDLRSWVSGVGEAPRVAFTALLISWPMFALLTATSAPHPARGALFAAVVGAAGASVARAIGRAALHRVDGLQQRTLILGSGTVAKQLVARLGMHPEFGLEPIGFIDDDVRDPGDLELPRLGTLDTLSELIGDGRVDRVIIAFTRSSHEQLLHCIRVCRDAGVTVDIVPRLFEFLDGARTEQIGGMPLLSIAVPSMSRLSRACKRVLDILGSGAILLALSPLMAVVAVAIKLDSPGPVLFRQRRPGQGGKLFTVFKFRSMRVDAGVEVGANGAIVKQKGDARVTRTGRFIRRFSLDEAPQLFNVLRGDMSLVGPRPLLLVEHDALTEAWQSRRADLRPGLTGPWQISGRSQIDLEERVRLDYQYVSGWSLARDIEILIATVPAVLSGRGAY
jgi:exopolysaccharide biosynthesis polyprenyl glycosylphosphotransferase